MARTNRTRFAVLGMLMSGPRSGYDLKKDFEEQISGFWSESLGQIYPALAALKQEKLVAVTSRRGPGRPERKVYRITKKGEEAFRHWLLQPAEPIRWRNELLLKVFFGTELETDEVLAHVQRLEASEREITATYKHFEREIEKRPATDKRRFYWRLALSSGRHLNKARLAWCREAKAALAEYAAQGGKASK